MHAGGDEAAGDPTYGTDAIWSHRSYAQPPGGRPGRLPGVNVGSNGAPSAWERRATRSRTTRPAYWVGDYTIQPENGGLGVFAHEFGHDLGLPDLYDTSGNTGGAENNTAFWTLMSSGANIGDGGPDGIGDAPTDMGAWSSSSSSAGSTRRATRARSTTSSTPGETAQHRLSDNVPATSNGEQAMVGEPAGQRGAGTPSATRRQGDWMWWSDQGSNLENTMTKTGVTGTAR